MRLHFTQAWARKYLWRNSPSTVSKKADKGRREENRSFRGNQLRTETSYTRFSDYTGTLNSKIYLEKVDR